MLGSHTTAAVTGEYVPMQGGADGPRRRLLRRRRERAEGDVRQLAVLLSIYPPGRERRRFPLGPLNAKCWEKTRRGGRI